MKRFLLIAALLLMASPIQAGTGWLKEGDENGLGTSGASAQSSINVGQTLVLEFVNGDSTFSTRQIDARACTGGVLFTFDPDILDATVLPASGAEAALWKAHSKAADGDQGTQAEMARAGSRILADIDGGGVDDVTLNGDDGTDTNQRQWISGVVVNWFWAQITVAAAAGDVAQLRASCYEAP